MEHIDPGVVGLTDADATAGLSLSTAAGWDQTLDDWHLLLRLGRGYGIRNEAGELIATGIALPYAPDIGWIGMLLVQSAYRRLGLASRLLLHAIGQLRSMGLVPMLDATPAGKLVYERMGFVEISGISRWRRAGARRADQFAPSDHLEPVLAVDRQAFGADRSQLLRAFAARSGSAVFVDAAQGGYVLCRPGRTAMHVGPMVTLDPERQGALFNAAVRSIDGPIVIDVPDAAGPMREAAEVAGFEIERPLTRMALGRDYAFGIPEMVAAIAGPEFG